MCKLCEDLDFICFMSRGPAANGARWSRSFLLRFLLVQLALVTRCIGKAGMVHSNPCLTTTTKSPQSSTKKILPLFGGLCPFCLDRQPKSACFVSSLPSPEPSSCQIRGGIQRLESDEERNHAIMPIFKVGAGQGDKSMLCGIVVTQGKSGSRRKKAKSVQFLERGRNLTTSSAPGQTPC